MLGPNVMAGPMMPGSSQRQAEMTNQLRWHHRYRPGSRPAGPSRQQSRSLRGRAAIFVLWSAMELADWATADSPVRKTAPLAAAARSHLPQTSPALARLAAAVDQKVRNTRTRRVLAHRSGSHQSRCYPITRSMMRAHPAVTRSTVVRLSGSWWGKARTAACS